MSLVKHVTRGDVTRDIVTSPRVPRVKHVTQGDVTLETQRVYISHLRHKEREELTRTTQGEDISQPRQKGREEISHQDTEGRHFTLKTKRGNMSHLRDLYFIFSTRSHTVDIKISLSSKSLCSHTQDLTHDLTLSTSRSHTRSHTVSHSLDEHDVTLKTSRSLCHQDLNLDLTP